MKRIITVLGLILVLAATACGKETVIQERVITVTASASPAMPDPTTTSAPVVEEAAAPSEAKACALLERAQGLPAYSVRWDDVMYDATEASVTDKMYTKVSRAYDTIEEPGYDYEQVATQRIADILDNSC
jgi:hypothetical protein